MLLRVTTNVTQLRIEEGYEAIDFQLDLLINKTFESVQVFDHPMTIFIF